MPKKNAKPKKVEPWWKALDVADICEREGKRYAIEARSVELTKPWPEGHLFLAAYLDWKSALG